jgi:transposase
MKDLTDRQRREVAKELRNQGYTLREVADIVDRSVGWVSRTPAS